MDEVPRSRRDEYSESTRRALLESARRLFAEKGFAATSLDEVAADARVTKGAVYHHFANKQALYEAVAEKEQQEACDAILTAAAGAPDAWSGVVAGLDCFLERCLSPAYQRLTFQEGPAVMGFSTWWQHGERHEIGLIRGMLASMDAEGLIDCPDLDAMTQLIFGAMTAVALTLARADDPRAERPRMREAALRLLAGLVPPGKTLPTTTKKARAPRKAPTRR